MGAPNLYHIDQPADAYDGSEIAIQTLFRNRCRMLCPRVQLVAVPNGTYIASLAGRSRAQREGLSAGFPDLMAIASGKIAFLEFKAKRGRLSESQTEWLDRLAAFGFPVGVFRHPDTAIEFLRVAGFPFSGRLAA